MKSIIIFTALFLFITAVFYMSGSFMYDSFNTANWDRGFKGLMLMFYFIGVIYSGVASFVIKD